MTITGTTVKFVKGTAALYTSLQAKDGIIFYATDTQEVYVDNIAFGMPSTLRAFLTGSDSTEGSLAYQLKQEHNARVTAEEGLDNAIGALELLVGETPVATQIVNAIEALDSSDTAVSGQYVSAVVLADGTITVSRETIPVQNVNDTVVANQFVTDIFLDGTDVKAHRSGITSSQVTRTATTGTNGIAATTVENALTELMTAINSTGSAGELKVYKDNTSGSPVSTISADGHDYIFVQGTTTIATLNIAKDMVVSDGYTINIVFDGSDDTLHENSTSGEDVTAAIMGESTPTAANAGKYIKLILANSSKIIYLPVNALVDVYTATNLNGKVQISIDNNNNITASVVAGSIEKTDLTSTLQSEISNATSAIDILNGNSSTAGSVDYKLAQAVSTLNTAIAAAKTVVNAKSTGHVTVSVTQDATDGHDIVTVEENDIASAQGLSDEITRAGAVEDNIMTAAGLTKGSSNAVSYTPGATATHTTNVSSIKDHVTALDVALAAIESKVGNSSVADQIAAAKALIDAYTVNGHTISSNPRIYGDDSQLTLTSGTYSKDVASTTILASDTVTDAIAKLDARLTWYTA